MSHHMGADVSFREFSDRFMAATKTGDRVALQELLHPDFTVEEPSGLPYAGVYRGLDGWLELTRNVVAAWSKFRIEPIEYPGETADSFVIRFAISGRSHGTGRSFDTTVLELWHFEDGRLARISPYYFDTYLLAELNKG